MKNFKKINIYFLYTIVFTLLALVVFSCFIKNGKSFIWDTDGYKQHYIIFQKFNSILKGTEKFSEYSWESGLGLDTIGQYSYYILGDPFAFLSILFSSNNLEMAYNLLIILRIYCIGLSFLAFCQYHKKGKYESIIGSILYTFSGFVLYASLKHPYFSNPLILLPLIFIGIDKILSKDDYRLFTITIAISAISNYYFCYMLTILSFIYAVTRYFTDYKEKGHKFFIQKFLKTLCSYIIGIIISFIIILPTIHSFLNSARGGTGFTYYGFGYYGKLLLMDPSTPFWSKIYISSIIIILLPIAISCRKDNKENKTILLNLLIGFIILLVPLFGSIMNGFSFQYNRWSFGFVFFLAYLVTNNIRIDLKYTRDELEKGMIFAIFYTLIALAMSSEIIAFGLASIGFAWIILITLFIRNSKKHENESATFYKIFIFIIIVCNICWFAYHFYIKTDYISEFLNYGDADKKYSTLYNKANHYDEAIQYIKENDKSFYRIGTNKYETSNLSLKYNYNSLNMFLSLGNKYIDTLSNDLIILGRTKTDSLREFDSRVQITTLLSSKYYIVSKKDVNYVPYGYTLKKSFGDNEKDAQIYENTNFLPIGVFYNNYILNEDYNKLTPLQKEISLLQSASINNTDLLNNISVKNYEKKNYDNYTVEVDSKIVDNNKVVNQKNKKIKITEDKNSFTIKFNEIKNSELYLYFENLNKKTDGQYYVHAKYKGITKEQRVRNKVSDAYYEPTPNILMNLGYKDIHSGTITVTFTGNGTYTYDNIKVLAVPMDKYLENINNLSSTPFELNKFDSNSIEGTISNKENGILQISTSYSTGWTAYVDGEKTNIINVNTGFVGIPLKEGSHEIRLEYSTPLLKPGIIFTIVGIISFAVVFVLNTKYLKKEKNISTNN